MKWSNRYISIPFDFDGRDFNGCDCWGLIRMVYLYELGIELPTYKESLIDNSVNSLRRVAKIMDIESNSERWIQVKIPIEMDLVLFRTGNVNCHVGIICGRNKMLHIQEGISASVENYTSPTWRSRITGFFRYVQ